MRTLPSFIGRYKVERWLGEGTFGDVYKGRDTGIQRDVAIKLLKAEADDPGAYVREAQAAGRLRHPYIVTIYELGEHQGLPFIVMEFVDGETLGQLIRRRAQIPLPRKLQIMAALCEGLAHAHKAGVIHRDIKPPNLMMDPGGVIKIVDFGIAKIGTSNSFSSIAGTWNYMSPEQITGQPLDHRSDVFSVGSVFYELLTLTKAFPGGPHDGISHRIVNQAPLPLREVCPEVGPAIEAIVNGALDKDPRRRYQDLEQMRDDIIAARRHLVAAEDSTQPLTRDMPSGGGRKPELVALRQQRIEKHIQQAQSAFGQGDYDGAIAEANEAALLNDEEQRAFDLINASRLALDERQAREWLSEARAELTRGHITAASDLIERALSLSPALQEASTLRGLILDTRRDLERAKAIRKAMDSARRSHEAGDFEGAVEHVKRVLHLDPANADALALHQSAADALEEQRRREEHERRATEAMAAARKKFIAGQHQEALDLLRDVEPEHPGVSILLEDLALEFEEIEHRRREDEARRRRERHERFERCLLQGGEALQRGDLESALSSADEALSIDPAEGRALELRATTLAAVERRRAERAVGRARQQFYAGQHELAIKQLQAFTPEDAGVNAALEELTIERERILAERTEEEARRRRVAALQAAIREAETRLAAGDLERTAVALRKALDLDPSSVDAQRVQHLLDKAFEDQRLKKERDRQAHSVAEDAERRFRAGEHESALEVLRGYQPPHPATATLLTRLSGEYQRLLLQRSREASAEQRRESLRTALDAARTALTAGNSQEALDRANEALGLEPGLAEAQQLRQLALKAQADKRQADALEARVDAVLAQAAQSYGRGRPEEALEALRTFKPPDGRVTAALEDFRHRAEVDRLEANRARGAELIEQARSAITSGRLDAALQLLQRAEDVSPDAPAIAALIAETQDLRSKADAARKKDADLERQLRLATDAITRGNLDVARAALAAAVALEPAHPRVAVLRATVDAAQAARKNTVRTDSAGDDPGVDTQPVLDIGSLGRTVRVDRRPSKPAPVTKPPETGEDSPPGDTGQTAPPRLPSAQRFVAGAAVVAVIAVGVFLISRTQNHTPRPLPVPKDPTVTGPAPTTTPIGGPLRNVPTPVPTIPGSGAAAEADIAKWRATAERQIDANQPQLALVTIVSGLKAAPKDPGLVKLLDKLTGKTREKAMSAKIQAMKMEAPRLAPKTFIDGSDQLEDGLKADRAGQREGAVKLFLSAAKTLDEAKKTAVEEKVTEDKAKAKATEDKARAKEAEDKARAKEAEDKAKAKEAEAAAVKAKADEAAAAKAKAGEAPVVTPKAPPTPVPPGANADEAAIRATLNAYQAALSKMDLAALRRVQDLSNSQVRSVQGAFDDHRTYEVTVTGAEIKVGADGLATARATRVISRVPKAAARATILTQAVQFTLKKRGALWIITAIYTAK